MAEGGWTPDTIDAMPMGDVLALLAWWREHPPAAAILAAVHGVKPAPVRDEADPSGIGALITRWPGSTVGVVAHDPAGDYRASLLK